MKRNYLFVDTTGSTPQERLDYLFGENGVLSPNEKNDYKGKFKYYFLFIVVEDFGSYDPDIFFESFYDLEGIS